jgi:glucuronoarabinoxylan endo-1,4-beta-xylanase
MITNRLPLLVTVAAAFFAARAAFAADTISVDAGVQYQVMAGFGSSERVFDDPHVHNNFNPATARSATVMTAAQQDEILDRLYRDLKLTRVRSVTEAGIEVVNDNADPAVTDLSKFNFDFKRNDAHIDYVARARSRGVDTWFLSPLWLESWMTPDTNKQEYVEWAMAIIRRWRDQGGELPYYSLINEPGYVRSGTWSGEWMRDVIKLLGPRLRAEGFATKIVIPDDVRASDAAARARVILADAEARRYVGALATHLYGESVSNVAQMRDLATQYGLPLWMTEFSRTGMPSAGLPGDPFAWGALMSDLISSYDVAAIDYMFGFFGQWAANSELVVLNIDGQNAYTGYTLPKVYNVTGQFSRHVRPGARRIKALSSTSNIKVSAFRDGGTTVVVACNMNGSLAHTVDLSLAGVSGPLSVQAVRTSGSENWADLGAVPVGGTSFSTTLPARSITTFLITDGRER